MSERRPIPETSDMTLTARGRTVALVTAAAPAPDGPPSRPWGLAQGLIAAGHDVQIITPDDLSFAREADIVLLDGWEHAAALPRPGGVLMIDVHAPRIPLTTDAATRSARISAKLDALRQARAVFCPTEAMRNYLYGWLLHAGVDLRADPPLVQVVPFPLPPEPRPVPLPDEPVFLYGGDFAPWYDPTEGLNILLDTLEAEGRGKLIVSGAESAWQGASPALEALKARLSASAQVLMVPDVGAHISEASVLWEVVAPGVLPGMHFPAHLADALYRGRAVVMDDAGAFSREVRRGLFGWVVPDPAAMRERAHILLKNAPLRQQAGDAARAYAAEQLNWKHVTAPLNHRVRQPDQYPAARLPFERTLRGL